MPGSDRAVGSDSKCVVRGSKNALLVFSAGFKTHNIALNPNLNQP